MRITTRWGLTPRFLSLQAVLPLSRTLRTRVPPSEYLSIFFSLYSLFVHLSLSLFPFVFFMPCLTVLTLMPLAPLSIYTYIYACTVIAFIFSNRMAYIMFTLASLSNVFRYLLREILSTCEYCTHTAKIKKEENLIWAVTILRIWYLLFFFIVCV